MGHGGRRYYLRGIVYYVLSPFQQNIMSGIHPGNMVRRVLSEIFYVMPPLLLGAFIHNQMDRIHHLKKLKQPRNFDDEDECVEVPPPAGGGEKEECEDDKSDGDKADKS